jgi:hypothetical protein
MQKGHVAAGGESAAGARHHHRAHLVGVGRELADRLSKRIAHLGRHGVERSGAVEAQHRHLAAPLHQNRGFARAS